MDKIEESGQEELNPKQKPIIAEPQTLLPALPDKKSFVEALTVGGILTVEPVDAIAAVKAAMAMSVGVFEVPDKLRSAMLAFAQENRVPCGLEFLKLNQFIAKREYSVLLQAMGIAEYYISPELRRQFITNFVQFMWPAIVSFRDVLLKWNQAWMDKAAGPAAMLAIVASSGGGKNLLPPDLTSPPDTTVVKDAAVVAIEEFNRVFAGEGALVVRSMAYEAEQIRDMLQDGTIVAATGNINNEQMLRSLGINITPDIRRLEQNLARYAMAIIYLEKVPAEMELNYLGAVLQLGEAISWDKVARGRATLVIE